MLAILLDFSLIELALILFACLLVLGSEVINTFVEDILDEIHPDHHSVIGKAKDMMAGLVLLHSIGGMLIGVAVFSGHFLYM